MPEKVNLFQVKCFYISPAVADEDICDKRSCGSVTVLLYQIKCASACALWVQFIVLYICTFCWPLTTKFSAVTFRVNFLKVLL